MAAAYQVATDGDKYVTQILIRGFSHATTVIDGVIVKDAPHVTLSWKTTLLEVAKMHRTSHGYTKSIFDYTLLHVKPAKYDNLDSALDAFGNPIWPEGLYSEVVWHQSPEVGSSTATITHPGLE